jgi:hypothetical protein
LRPLNTVSSFFISISFFFKNRIEFSIKTCTHLYRSRKNRQSPGNCGRVKVSGSQSSLVLLRWLVAAIPLGFKNCRWCYIDIGALQCQLHRRERRRITKSNRRQDHCRISRDRACHERVKLL